MKISNLNQYNNPNNLSSINKKNKLDFKETQIASSKEEIFPTAITKSAHTDKLSISADSKNSKNMNFANLIKQQISIDLKSNSQVQSEKINNLKQSIQNNQYGLDPIAIATMIVNNIK